jgi:hypothetical protein
VSTHQRIGERLRDCCGIVLIEAALLLALRPLQNTPFIDDWTYAWSVERLLTHGDLKILDWSSNPNVMQVLWGALFCLPFGFSFTALRTSTWVLAVSCLCGLYVLLRDFAVSRRAACLGVAVLGVNPIFFVLSYTFMTDVPFLAVMTWCCVAMARALQKRDGRWLVAAAALATVASGIRTVGVVIPVAMALTLFWHTGSWGRKAHRLALACVPLLFAALFGWWAIAQAQHLIDLSALPNAPVNRFESLRYGIAFLPRMLLFNVSFVSEVVGLALVPLSFAAARWSRLREAALICAVLGMLEIGGLFVTRPYVPLLSSGATWALTEVGATEQLIPNFEPPGLPGWWRWTAPILTSASFAFLIATLLRRRHYPHEAFLLWLATGQFVLMALLWLFHDRYALVLFPSAITLLLARTDRLRVSVALPLIAVFALVSSVGMYDHLQLNRALWRAVSELRGRGVPDDEIDAGYVVNGWLQCAHPEHAPRDARGNPFVPMLTTSSGMLPYEVSVRPLPGWKTLDVIPYRRWLGPSGAIWVLRRDDGGPR